MHNSQDEGVGIKRSVGMRGGDKGEGWDVGQLTGSGHSLPLTLTQILAGNLSSCSQLVSAKQNLSSTKINVNV